MKAVSEYNGLVVVDKPAGMTSHDVVDVARRCFRTRKIGHTGTLDPDATGVLVLCVGTATRLAAYLAADRKHYDAEFVFGIETDSLDASGTVTAQRDASALTRAMIEELLPAFRGTINQIPPMVSARHHQGQRLYELAREGITVEREARSVHIDLLAIGAFTPGERAEAQMSITCSSGTYIRALAADIGAAAATGGIMKSLRRAWVGADADNCFRLSDAVTIDAMRASAEQGRAAELIRPLVDGLRGWPTAHLDAAGLDAVRHGKQVAIPGACAEAFGDSKRDSLIALLGPDGSVCAIANACGDRLQPIKVLNAI